VRIITAVALADWRLAAEAVPRARPPAVTARVAVTMRAVRRFLLALKVFVSSLLAPVRGVSGYPRRPVMARKEVMIVAVVRIATVPMTATAALGGM